MAEDQPHWLLRSKAYKKATRMVSSATATPAALEDLVARARAKFDSHHGGKLSGLIDSVKAVFRLMQAYARGEYRDVSLESLALIVASIIYFLMPLDVLPDFILGFGFVDDAALLTWTFRSVADDIERFLAWESARDKDNHNDLAVNPERLTDQQGDAE